MRTSKALFIAIVFSCLLAILPVTNGQTARMGVHPEDAIATARDPGAIKGLEAAITAMGGPIAWKNVQKASATGKTEFSADGAKHSAGIVWKDDWSQPTLEYRREFQDGSDTGLLVSAHGSPGNAAGGKKEKVPARVSLGVSPLHLPAWVLSHQLADPRYSLQVITDKQNVPGVLHIRTSLRIGTAEAILTPQDWYFDATSGLPLRVEYKVATISNPLRGLTAAMEFSDFREVSGVMVPFHLTETAVGGTRSEVSMSAVVVNPTLAATDFEIPQGGTQ